MNIGIILSGGTGSRLGADIPKQYINVGGKPIFLYCVETFLSLPSIDAINFCVADEWKGFVEEHLSHLSSSKSFFFSSPGDTRQLTIYRALQNLQAQGVADDSIVIIHDAARPLVSAELLQACIDHCADADGVLPVLPVKDTMYQSIDGKSIAGLLNRSELFAGQAPESFRFGQYLGIHDALSEEELRAINGSSEIAHKAGLAVRLIPGEERNFKVTTPQDLIDFQKIIEA